MSYAQLHDGFYRNVKVRRAGNMAAWMWAASIGYANENLTDGFVPREVLSELSELDSKPRMKLAAKLVEVGLWEPAEGGWRIHDFLKWNLSREAVLRKRAENLARVNKHRTGGVSHGEGNARVMHYNASDSGRTNAISNTPPSVPLTSVPLNEEGRQGSAEGATAPKPPPSGDTPSGAAPLFADVTDGQRRPAVAPPEPAVAPSRPDAPKAKGRPRKAPPAPVADTIPLAGTLAHEVYRRIVGHRLLAPMTVNPGEFAVGITDPARYPGVNVLAVVIDAAEYLERGERTYSADGGRAFLKNQLRVALERAAAKPRPAALAGPGTITSTPKPAPFMVMRRTGTDDTDTATTTPERPRR